MMFRVSLVVAIVMVTVSVAGLSWADPFSFSTNSSDGRLGALSQPPNSGALETETADDFLLAETTSITEATIVGLVPTGTSLANIRNVEIEIYHVSPKDSDVARTSGPPTFSTPAVPARANSPGDVEIGSATRDGSQGTLTFSANRLSSSFSVLNTVVNGINKAPNNVTHGEGPSSGEPVQITITFTPPVLLPADHYFFRPEVLVTGGRFLYLSAPRPIVAPGTPFVGDLQAWIRNSDLKPDWLRIGTDIIDGSPAPTFNMTFALKGETIPEAGTPGQANCHGQSVSAVARQFGGVPAAASALGFSSVKALQDGLKGFCQE
jgi:hypothetical protein